MELINKNSTQCILQLWFFFFNYFFLNNPLSKYKDLQVGIFTISDDQKW